MITYGNNNLHPSVERLDALRKSMQEEAVDFIIIHTADPHMSEYLGETDKCRQYYSGFTGSAGSILVGEDEAYLWTDSRYFVQAEMELRGSDFQLMKEGEDGVPSMADFIANHIWEGQTIGLDYKTVSINELQYLRDIVPDNCEIIDASRIINKNWIDKPKRIFNDITILNEDLTGKSTEEKINEIRRGIEEHYVAIEDSYTYIVADLCDIMWILNIRGEDISYVPVAYSYLTIDANCVSFYCNKKAISKENREILEDNNIIIKEYGNFYNSLDDLATDYVLLDPEKSNAYICEKFPGMIRVIECDNSLLIRKHIKNKTEIEGIINAHKTDAIIMTRFIYKLKNMTFTDEDEYTLGKMLDDMRLNSAECKGLSFETICAYDTNAAIVHYSAQENNCKKMANKGFVLIDSGAHYEMGTTDVTRTISLGELSEKEKLCYTMVLKGNLNLMNTIFPKGVRGDNLDIIARKPIWEKGFNYGHGTGHGIGCRLSVHESPVRISYKGNTAVLSEGVVVSDEPGIYLENELGVRLENALRVEKCDNYGDFYRFVPLTLVPFDRAAILENELTDEEIIILNNYNNNVIEEVSASLNEEERLWLMKECAPITR